MEGVKEYLSSQHDYLLTIIPTKIPKQQWISLSIDTFQSLNFTKLAVALQDVAFY